MFFPAGKPADPDVVSELDARGFLRESLSKDQEIIPVMFQGIMGFHIAVHTDRPEMDHRLSKGSPAGIAEHPENHFTCKNRLYNNVTAAVCILLRRKCPAKLSCEA